MKFCPFIGTPTHKVEPSAYNCKDCYFYVGEPMTMATYCAIRLTAERASNTAAMLQKVLDKRL